MDRPPPGCCMRGFVGSLYFGMCDLSKLRIQCSPITGTIYAGRVNKAGDGWVGQKTDVTSDVLGSVIQKIGAGETIIVRENGQPAYEIEVRDIRATENK